MKIRDKKNMKMDKREKWEEIDKMRGRENC
jgi:hypothetical protein